MYKRLFAAALVFGLAAGAPPATPALAQTACGPRDTITTVLTETYGESRKGIGLQNPQVMFELWTSEETGSWTILATRADGVTCMVASGLYWQAVDGAALAAGDPA